MYNTIHNLYYYTVLTLITRHYFTYGQLDALLTTLIILATCTTGNYNTLLTLFTSLFFFLIIFICFDENRCAQYRSSNQVQ